MARKFVPCLVCDPQMRFDPPIRFLNHFHWGRAHSGDEPQDFEAYKKWVATQYEIKPEHEVFDTPGALTRPEEFQEFEHLFK